MADELDELVAAAVAPLGLELFELDRRSGRSHVVIAVVDRPGGADLDTIAEATRVISSVLDEHDPFPGHRYTLEVSSPGVERPLRTPAQFARAVGETVSIRTVAGTPGERRVQGVLVEADEQGISVRDPASGECAGFTYAEVERARTVFEWGPAPRPGSRRPSRDRSGGTGPRRHGDRERVTTRS